MKKIKIFSVPSHATIERTSGVDFARIIQPMKYLNGYKDDTHEFQTEVFSLTDEKNTNWLKVFEDYKPDILFFNYTTNPWGFANMGMFARKYKVPLVLDMDDALWNVQVDNPAYTGLKKGSEGLKNFTAICNEVDYITTTNTYLRNIINHNTNKPFERIKVFPNYIDLSLYKHRSLFKDTLDITLLHFGSTTHFMDLAEEEFKNGVDKIMKEYPNVNVKFVGTFSPEYKRMWGQRFTTAYGHTDIYKWIGEKFAGFMDEADIIVIPLANNTYTRAKSGIKYLESASAKKPVVAQRMRQYEELIHEGVNGYLAANRDEWYSALKSLIDDKQLRKDIGEAAFETIVEGHQIQNHAKDYAEFFKSLVDGK